MEKNNITNNGNLNIDLSDVSDSEDPTFDPKKDVAKVRKAIPDYFNLRSTPSTSSKISLVGEDDLDSRSSSAMSFTLESESSVLSEEDPQNAYLDGRFYKVLNHNGKKIITECQLCLPKVHTISGVVGVSTNFVRHIKRVHPEASANYQQHILSKKVRKTKRMSFDSLSDGHSEIRNKRQKTIESFIGIGNRRPIAQEVFEKRLIEFTVSSMSSITILDNPAFKQIFDGMDLKVISRRTAMRRITDLNTKTMEIIKCKLLDVQYCCTTADIWSAKKRSFLGVTCHWIGNDLSRHSAALACKRFAGVHSYDRIAELLENIHLSFGLKEDKIMATVTDNGSNFLKAFKEFGVKVSSNLIAKSVDSSELCTNDNDEQEPTETADSSSDEDEEDKDEVILPTFKSIVAVSTPSEEEDEEDTLQIQLPKHQRCASHTINLIAVTDTKNAINSNTALRKRHTNVLNKCSLLWNKSSYPKSAEIIKGFLGHYLSYPGVTRWNSLFDALTQLLKDKDKLNQLFVKLNVKQSFNDSELLYLEEYCKVMTPLAHALDILQGERNIYYGYLIPCIASVTVKLNKLQKENLHLVEPILKACVDGIQRRFSNFVNLTAEVNDAIIASLTIPKFKFKWLNAFKVKDKSLRSVADLQKVVTNAIHEMIKAETDNCFHNELDAFEKHKSTAEDLFFEFNTDEQYNNTNSEESKSKLKNDIELEVLHYINDPSTDVVCLNNYPNIKKLFVKYNTVLPSSAPVERLFSFASIINAPKRHAITDKHFECLVLLKANQNYTK